LQALIDAKKKTPEYKEWVKEHGGNPLNQALVVAGVALVAFAGYMVFKHY